MPFSIQQSEQDPILIIMADGQISLDEVRELYAESDRFYQQINFPVVWRILDITEADITFGDVITAVKQLSPDTPGSLSDPRFRSVFPTKHPMARLISNILAQPQFGSIDIPVVAGLGDALIYAHEEIQKLKSGDSV